MNYRDPDAATPVLIVTLGAKIFGMEPATGKLRWRYEFPGTGVVRLQIREDRIYALGTDLVCLDYLTGKVIWNAATDVINGMLLLHEGRLYLASYGEVACFTVDGRSLWKEPFKGEGTGPMSLGFPGNFIQADTR